MGFFKAYDMRGTFGIDFDLDTVYRVGKALPQVVPGRRWLVGRDCRTTSDAVRDALVAGLSEAGAEVTDIGRVTTPMVYFFTAEHGFDGSVMITASHNPSTDNGLKVSRRGALPVGFADGLNEVERLVAADSSKYVASAAPAAESDGDWLRRYADWMLARRPDLRGLRYAVDCSNGMSSLLVRELFPEAELINERPDGTFPAHSPNPLQPAAREQLSALVRERGLDCGVIFDGDADRAMFVDGNGDFVQPDYLIPVVARMTAAAGGIHVSGQVVVHDVRTSRGAIESLREAGFAPQMVPVGHAFAKPALRASQGVCGGELAGHYYFSEFFACDSGVLAAFRVLGAAAQAKRGGRSFAEMMRPVVSRYENSGEVNFKVEDKDAAIARVLECAREKLPREISRSDLDGIRIEFEEGWFNIRKSNTEPYLRLVVERRERVREWLELMDSAIRSSDLN